MSPVSRPLARLLQEDQRYQVEAYLFVTESLNYAHEVLELGSPTKGGSQRGERGPHLTGPELCEAIRVHALEQFGLLAKVVLNNWGIRSTGDIGEIVYNLIRIGELRKSKKDRREDFDDVFDFDEGLQQRFEFTLPDA